ncbi:hypothetical protein ASG14_07245 [Pedobacter sp. Leaf194]|nr:hypothetical protein ASG14_07245 [Pedobacter sp. Leaf194]
MHTPASPLNRADLKTLNEAISNKNIPPEEKLELLKQFFLRLEANEEQLIRFEYMLDLRSAKRDYLKHKTGCEERLQGLKIQFKQIDNRIIAAEQKLSRGIPDDLELMEKLIAEQESIVFEQEKLNAAESVLTEELSTVNIAYGKSLERIEQMLSNRTSPLDSRFEVRLAKLELVRRRVLMTSKVAFLAPLIAVPVLADFMWSLLTGHGTLTKNHGILSHYIFFVVLILFYFLLAERVKEVITDLLASFHINKSFSELEALLKLNQETVSALELQHQLSLAEALKDN